MVAVVVCMLLISLASSLVRQRPFIATSTRCLRSSSSSSSRARRNLALSYVRVPRAAPPLSLLHGTSNSLQHPKHRQSLGRHFAAGTALPPSPLSQEELDIMNALSSIVLTPEEDELFATLRAVVTDAKLGTTVRVAGGWVRDKLLGVRGKEDIDIALDNMKGSDFAASLNTWHASRGLESFKVPRSGPCPLPPLSESVTCPFTPSLAHAHSHDYTLDALRLGSSSPTRRSPSTWRLPPCSWASSPSTSSTCAQRRTPTTRASRRCGPLYTPLFTPVTRPLSRPYLARIPEVRGSRPCDAAPACWPCYCSQPHLSFSTPLPHHLCCPRLPRADGVRYPGRGRDAARFDDQRVVLQHLHGPRRGLHGQGRGRPQGEKPSL